MNVDIIPSAASLSEKIVGFAEINEVSEGFAEMKRSNIDLNYISLPDNKL